MQDVFFHRVNAATVRVLAAEGWDVLVPRDQQCCGALEFHSGREEPALARARREIGVYSDLDVDYVVTNVAGCGSSMKEYGHLLDDDAEWAERAKAFSARVRDVHEVLAEGEPRATRHPVRARVAYHDACHLGHAQKVRAQPRAVLRSIPGVELLDLPEAELCCGSAGIYNMVAPEAAGELGARKAENIRGDPAGHRRHRQPGLPAADRQAPRRRRAAAAPGAAARREHPRGAGTPHLTSVCRIL